MTEPSRPERRFPSDAPPARGAAFPWRLFFIAAIAASLVAALALWTRRPTRAGLGPASTSHIEVRPSPNVVVAVRDLARLETVNYHMERVVELTDEQTHLFGLVRGRDALLLIAVGDVVAGVDLAQLHEADAVVDWPHRHIRITLPAPQVFSATLDNARTHVYSRNTDTLAQRREDLEERARREAESNMRAAALDGGILVRARSSAERAIHSLLLSLGFEHIEIVTRLLTEGG